MKIWNLFIKYSYTILIVGMGCILVGAYLLVNGRESGNGLDNYAWPVVIVGICIYLIARIGIHIRSKRSGKVINNDSDDSVSIEDIKKGNK